MDDKLSEFLRNDDNFATRSVHKGSDPKKWSNKEIIPPISLSTSFLQEEPLNHKGYNYIRSGNPTRSCLQECLASLEEAKHCLTFASGMAAISTTIHLLGTGDHVVTITGLYHGVFNFFLSVASNMGIEVSFSDPTDLEGIEQAILPSTKMVWIETPTNPTFKVTDIRKVAAVTAKKSKAFLVVDNTFMSPYFQRPLLMGADIVMHSCTKYLNGHTDVLMGALCTNRDDLHQRLLTLQATIGSVPSPFDCYLLLRSLRTLELRMQRHMTNALAVAEFLEGHPRVTKVLHPGLPSHPQHEIAKKQCYGHSGMLSFYLEGDDLEKTMTFLQNLKIFTVAESLGGFDSVVKIPSQMPPESMTKDELEREGITDGLIRLSIGLESPKDLIKDLRNALDSLEI